MFARWKTFHRELNSSSPMPQASQTPQLSKEYVYAGGKLIATEEPGIASSATFIKADTTTQGNWKNTYGSEGYNIINDAVSYPAYAQVTPSSNLLAVWSASTSDARALQKVASTTDRLAACWYQSSYFTIDVNLTDGQAHQIALYNLDWDGSNQRSQQIDILNATTNAVLDSRSVTSFSTGKYMVWHISGHVTIKITRTGIWNSVIGGIFFDSTSTNLALNRTASQSSDYPAPGYTADKAVNGNLTDVMHTQLESQPWWQVDLGSVQMLNSIKLWNRVDCCQERLSNFYVFVSNTPFQYTTVTQTQSQAGVASYYTAGQAGASVNISMNPNQTGRYVRVQLAGSNFLSLAEVQVWGGPAPNRTNVALSASGSVASASSQYNASFPATAAINGDRFNLYQPDNTYNAWHSYGLAPKPDWLQVDFNGSKTIDEIDVVTLQDNYTNPINPTEATTFTLYGLTAFEVQYWNGTSWLTVPGGSVTGNNKVWRKFTFAAMTTSKVRVLISTTADGYSRVMELEAWGVN
jgi:hypothetical protein